MVYLSWLFIVLYSFLHIQLCVSTKKLYQRSLWEDLSLPQPLSSHELIQFPKSVITHGRKTKADLTPLYPGMLLIFLHILFGSCHSNQHCYYYHYHSTISHISFFYDCYMKATALISHMYLSALHHSVKL